MSISASVSNAFKNPWTSLRSVEEDPFDALMRETQTAVASYQQTPNDDLARDIHARVKQLDRGLAVVRGKREQYPYITDELLAERTRAVERLHKIVNIHKIPTPPLPPTSLFPWTRTSSSSGKIRAMDDGAGTATATATTTTTTVNPMFASYKGPGQSHSHSQRKHEDGSKGQSQSRGQRKHEDESKGQSKGQSKGPSDVRFIKDDAPDSTETLIVKSSEERARLLQEQDQLTTELDHAVDRLKSQATVIHEELNLQSSSIDQLGREVDTNIVRMDNTRSHMDRLKAAVSNASHCDLWIIGTLTLIVVLLIVLVIWM